ncbi:MAG: hypothetical protein CBB96_03685 [Gammaproteobacteria bacterium TMED36]|nr:MAG: hypothetical protein CBB96_03685 [Gammaproteobacteria bacterium TMED36]|tara:strand:+ start:121 stop:1206 length:1086 start_codon:yes stop_codon:yes gene_type:complete
MSIKIAGIQDGHDVSYCILEDGVPTIHEELERFSRIKEGIGDGLEFFFKNNNSKDIKYYASGNPGGREYLLSRKINPNVQLYQKKMLNIVKMNKGSYYAPGHHQNHAAGAFFASNFNKALVITLDGAGTEYLDPNNMKDKKLLNIPRMTTAFTIWNGNDTKIERIHMESYRKFSIGALWHHATQKIFGLSIGAPHGHQAGTVMAMATMGDPEKYFNVFISNVRDNCNINWENYRKIAKSNEQKSFDLAAALQKATEVRFKDRIAPYIEKYDGENICFSGGASLNSVMIGKITEWFPKIKNIYCDPIPYDGGLSLGAARYVWHHILSNPRIKWEDNSSPYLGRTYGIDEINETIKKYSNLNT